MSLNETLVYTFLYIKSLILVFKLLIEVRFGAPTFNYVIVQYLIKANWEKS